MSVLAACRTLTSDNSLSPVSSSNSINLHLQKYSGEMRQLLPVLRIGCGGAQAQTASLPPPNLQNQVRLGLCFAAPPQEVKEAAFRPICDQSRACSLYSSFSPPHQPLSTDHPLSLLYLQPLFPYTSSFSSTLKHTKSLFQMGKLTEWIDCVINFG